MQTERTHNGKLINRIVYISVAAIGFVGIVLTVISVLKIGGAYEETVQEMLKVGCEQLDSQMSQTWDGDWSVDGDKLYKGEQDVTEDYSNTLAELKTRTGLEYTVFYGNTRMVTTTKDVKPGSQVG